ncbi:hypothetical protein SLEP1_g53398 [Rubroshorea leprosula]|uniref:Uncharacterized protein n=1 Tax=Rubroshorea leprosula TaxID=152421 RepID=A0AAV5M9E8_9ROSI|nr:hypothetical protein SLEP1_g53398 [Rubroshorea leprosula]
MKTVGLKRPFHPSRHLGTPRAACVRRWWTMGILEEII